jgi:hypothetical protein
MRLTSLLCAVATLAFVSIATAQQPPDHGTPGSRIRTIEPGESGGGGSDESPSEADRLRERVAELEDLVRKQQELIDLYERKLAARNP